MAREGALSVAVQSVCTRCARAYACARGPFWPLAGAVAAHTHECGTSTTQGIDWALSFTSAIPLSQHSRIPCGEDRDRMSSPSPSPMSALAGVHGCIPSVPVAFHADLALNTQPIARMVDLLAARGCRAVFVGGTFSEGFALAPHERQALLQAWVRAASPRCIAIIAHCSYESLTSTRETAAAAVAAGCAAIALAPTTLAPATTAEQVLRWMECVGQALPRQGVPTPIPMLYYHRPSKFGASPSCLEILQLVHDSPSRWPHVSFAGIKHCEEGGVVELAACLAYARDHGMAVDMMPAMEETLLPAAALGARVCMVGAGFYAWDSVSGLWGAVHEGDLATATGHYRHLMALAGLVRSRQYGEEADMQKAVAEAAMTGLLTGMAGNDPLDPSYSPLGPPRPPYLPMAVDKRAQLHRDLQGMGFRGLQGQAHAGKGGMGSGMAPTQPTQKAARL